MVSIYYSTSDKKEKYIFLIESKLSVIIINQCSGAASYICRYMWPDLPKPATYAHNGKERSSSPIDNSINKLTKCHNTTATSWLVCFFWGLFLRPVRHPQVLRCLLIATGLACTGSHRAENHHLTHSWCRPWF